MYKIKLRKAELTLRGQKAAMYGLVKAAHAFRDHVKELIGIYMFGQHSMPGDPPYIQTGDLRNSIKIAISPEEVDVYTDSPYWEYLEYGTSRMEPRPFWRRSIAEMEPHMQGILADAMKHHMQFGKGNFSDADDRSSYNSAKKSFFG